MTWGADKAAGELAEIALRRWCDCAGLSTEGAPGNFPAFDFFIRACVEVKRDRRAITTGNFFLKQPAYGKLSGISTTRATTWALVSERTAYLIGTEKLGAVLDSLRPAAGPDGKQDVLLPVRTLRALPHVEVHLSRWLE